MISDFEEIVNKNTLEFYGNDGSLSMTVKDRIAAAARDGYLKVESILLRNGLPRTLELEMKKIPYEDSFAIVVYASDLTDVRAHEEELSRMRKKDELQLAKLNMVVQASKIALWDMDVVKEDPVNLGNRIIWSDDVRHMLGFTDENDFPNLIGTLQALIHPDDKERVIGAFAAHLMDKTGAMPYDIEYRLQKKSGEYGYYRASGATIRDADGNPVRVAGALMNITEQKNLFLEAERQRNEAEKANKAKSSFLSTMSHEIRTPMNAILGITEIQLRNEKLDSSVKEALEKIYNSGDLLLCIINDILDLSKIEAGKLELSNKNYDVASLISDTTQLNMMRIGSKPIDFELFIDENIPAQMSGDELRIKQILNNLLSNAFKYTTEGSVKLSITAEETKSGNEVILVISVSDTGPGMTREQINMLFDEYARFNQGANIAAEGTGLGMSITRNLIRLMNGNIFVESEPGKGTTFTVRLPQGREDDEKLGVEMAENLEKFRSSSKTRLNRVHVSYDPMPYGKVLIVDDVDINIYVAMGLLAPYELQIDTAESGIEAVDKVKKGNVYDIIFMDHMMPQMDGIEATLAIRAMGYIHPIVALTANAVSGQANLFLENGFSDFISKPIDIRQMNIVLNKFIRDKYRK
jgi:PAS domain S-box-containing protein